MGDQIQERFSSTAAPLWALLRRPLLAAFVVAIILFVAAFYIPAKWVSAVSWQLYLDRLSPLFAQPVAWNGRILLGGVTALFVSLITLFIILFAALLKSSRGAAGTAFVAAAQTAAGEEKQNICRDDIADSAVSDDCVPEVAAGEIEMDFVPADDLPARNKQDIHPDDAPRAPIRAIRDLPPGGLGPPKEASVALHPGGEPVLVLADLASKGRIAPGEEPWLQAVEPTGPARPDRSDISLSAMVARLEAGFLRRRANSAPAAIVAVPVPDAETPPPGRTVADHRVDLALEAALGTLHRMNLRAVG